MNDDFSIISVILSYINDYISVPISKTLTELYRTDYKLFKKKYVRLCSELTYCKDMVESVLEIINE